MIPKRMPYNSKHKRTAETQKTLTPLFSQRQTVYQQNNGVLRSRNEPRSSKQLLDEYPISITAD